ncbi:flavin-containing monooxygenase [Dermacoccaceae bacterium W4C1]
MDAIVLGAGFSGVYLVKRLRDEGFSVRAFEAGSDVGGTWFWNRYPGARCDSDSHVYCYSDQFDADLAASWQWSERYPTQPEILNYIRHAAEVTGAREDFTFDTRVESAIFEEDTNLWRITTDKGDVVRARYFLPAVGALTKPNIPQIPGQESFAGDIYHTARMPEGLDLSGRRIAVVGAGATAVQVVPVAAKTAVQVYQLLRSPSHCLPGRNHDLDEDDQAEIQENRAAIWAQARANAGGFPYADYAGEATDYTSEQQQEILERSWRLGGLPMAFATFSDLAINRDSNQIVLDFMSSKIHSIVRDPEVARELSPTTPFISKRPPIEHGYYAAFNRDNVTLVNIADNPIARMEPDGIVLRDGTQLPVDLVLFATGFDAFTGALNQIDIRGVGGRELAAHHREGYDNFLGLSVAGFPNMFFEYCGPQGPGILTNGLTLIEAQGEWIVNALAWLRAEGVVRADVTVQAQDEFTQLHEATAAATLLPETDSWWTGANVDGKKRGLVSFCGGFPAYSALMDQAAEKYADYELTRS